MNKGLEALEELKFQVGNITYHTHDLQITTFKVRDSGLFELIEKELKALEIIKEKNVDIVGVKKLSLEDYNKGVELGDKYKPKEMKECPYKKLTQDEYDLLKEVLL
ncbi:MAG: hypothetical protein IKA31_01885 [Clostridia bacterium]|nr:hypothetical protein [Clostridia bacterium]MBR3890119.1 hypothetical protein [bacterium]